ncbi:MAG: phosphoenolpyruvate synthase [Candidatus Dependentiae bacterium]
MKYIKRFDELGLKDVGIVGGKNASLGQMIVDLAQQGIKVPMGFAITAAAYRYFLTYNNLIEPLKEIRKKIIVTDHQSLSTGATQLRELIKQGNYPIDLQHEIEQAYKDLSAYYKQKECDVAVRSSATAEDLPGASFAGQQETYLHIRTITSVLDAIKKCFASLFTERAIVYRAEKGFDDFDVAISVGIQKMIRSDLACSGVAFSLDTESGFKDAVIINAAYGLGEAIVQGHVTPDEFVVFKKTLHNHYRPILKKNLGQKSIKLVYGKEGELIKEQVPVDLENSFSLTDDEILELARYVVLIEEHYSRLENRWVPMDIEWAKDGVDNQIYIIQARPETVHAQEQQANGFIRYSLSAQINPSILVTGQSIGQKIASGKAKIVSNVDEIGKVESGDIIVTQMTDPDWLPALKKAAGIITDKGGRTCHAAIVARELGIPAIVGTGNATQVIPNEELITIDCSQGMVGMVYHGSLPFNKEHVSLKNLPKLNTKLMINLADPDRAFSYSSLPVEGVGLARIEFIINTAIKIHPMALIAPGRVTDKKVHHEIEQLTAAYPDKQDYFVDKLAQGVGMIAAAFYPKPVIVRFSDFKSNEYKNLIGGSFFEPEEENPMIGFRGASRYYHPEYEPAFKLECAAIKKAREEMGLTNIKVMVPFVRTVSEAEKVIKLLEEQELLKDNGLAVIMMCEVPSNVILIDKFSQYFDGFSIGSNDLTQLTLGIDRDSALLSDVFDERDSAVMKMIELALQGAQKNDRPIGICGQAPSDYPEIAHWLLAKGIDSISLNPDTVIPFLQSFTEK